MELPPSEVGEIRVKGELEDLQDVRPLCEMLEGGPRP
jgi:hypothetical protein